MAGSYLSPSCPIRLVGGDEHSDARWPHRFKLVHPAFHDLVRLCRRDVEHDYRHLCTRGIKSVGTNEAPPKGVAPHAQLLRDSTSAQDAVGCRHLAYPTAPVKQLPPPPTTIARSESDAPYKQSTRPLTPHATHRLAAIIRTVLLSYCSRKSLATKRCTRLVLPAELSPIKTTGTRAAVHARCVARVDCGLPRPAAGPAPHDSKGIIARSLPRREPLRRVVETQIPIARVTHCSRSTDCSQKIS
eukprot:COSAG05_NODE_510_length_9123_cov_3.605053_6_plen_244_part_00